MAGLVDAAAGLTIAVTFVLVLRSKQFATDRVVRRTVVVGVLLRTAYSAANVAIGPIFGLVLDAQAFHKEAVRFADGQGISVGLVNGWVYSAAVGALYRVTGGGLFFGQQLSIVAVVLTAASMLRIMGVMGIRQSNRRWVIAIVMLLPSSIVFTSGTLREAFQQLLFVLTVEFAIKMIRQPSVGTASMLGASVILGASLHGAIAVAGFAVALGAVVLSGARHHRSWNRIGGVPRYALAVALVGALFIGLSAPNVLFPYELSGGALSAATSFREGTAPARADYLRLGPDEEISLSTIPLVFGLYQIAPLPWQVTAVTDLVALLEAIGRIVLVALAVIALVHVSRAPFTRFAQVLLLLGGWITLELAWSLGTTNWGTGARHHVVAFPLLAIAAAACPRAAAIPTGDANGATSERLGANGVLGPAG